jgi:hypothetical protein
LDLARLVMVFAESIWVKSKAARELDLDVRQRRRLLESVSEDIKKWTDVIPVTTSAAAQAEAERRGVDLRSMGWHDQHRFDPGRVMFQWEHVVSVRHIREACLAAGSTDGVAEVLKTARVAWILKEEDRRLTGLGYRSVRPDPTAAYVEAGIILLDKVGAQGSEGHQHASSDWHNP